MSAKCSNTYRSAQTFSFVHYNVMYEVLHVIRMPTMPVIGNLQSQLFSWLHSYIYWQFQLHGVMYKIYVFFHIISACKKNFGMQKSFASSV